MKDHLSDPRNPKSVWAYMWFRTKRCPKCGTRVEPTYNFCPQCGSKLKETEGKDEKIQAEDKDFAILGILSLLLGAPIAFILYRNAIIDSIIGFNLLAFIIFVLGCGTFIGFCLLLFLTIIGAVVIKIREKQRKLKKG
jgi:hypothetical protein